MTAAGEDRDDGGMVSPWRGTAAARLTALFYEARFSSHPVDRRRRDEAERALDELAAALDELRADAPTPGNARR